MLLLCVTLLCGALFATVYNKKIVSAQNTADNVTTVGEIWNGQSINGSNVLKLFKQITNDENATIQNVKEAAATPKGGKDFYSYSAGGKLANKDIIVEFAGLKWTAVYLM